MFPHYILVFFTIFSVYSYYETRGSQEPVIAHLDQSCFQSYWFQTRWFLCEFPIGSYVKLSTAVQPSWSEGGTTRRNFGKGPFNDYFIKVWFQLSNWFQTRRFLCEFPIGSYVKLSSAVGAILVEEPNRLTYFWKRTIQ